MTNAVEWACEAFARDYNAQNIMKDLDGNLPKGHYTSKGLMFALLFPTGIKEYSRKDLIPDLYWYIVGYTQEHEGPKMRAKDIIKSAFSSRPVEDLVRFHEAYQKGLAERVRVIEEIRRTSPNFDPDVY